MLEPPESLLYQSVKIRRIGQSAGNRKGTSETTREAPRPGDDIVQTATEMAGEIRCGRLIQGFRVRVPGGALPTCLREQ